MKHVVFLPNNEPSTFDCLQEVGYGGNMPNPVKYWIELDYGPPDRFCDPYNHPPICRVVWPTVSSSSRHLAMRYQRSERKARDGPQPLAYTDSKRYSIFTLLRWGFDQSPSGTHT